MQTFLAQVRHMFDRARGLFHRGLLSLRTQGWRTTLRRTRQYLRRPSVLPPEPLWFPEEAGFAPFSVPSHPAPTVSIVIPVYNQARYTLACLRALSAHPSACPAEIIVVDDGSSDETAAWMERTEGVRYHRRITNGGFIAACNDGAALARGDYLVFLNNDTVPQPGWLDALLATFGEHPGTGLAAAQLIYPDGRLQEAGGLVFSDGSAWNYGRFESPRDPRYASVRETGYGSGAAIAIATALFRIVGGFDTRYAPAYYEDTDLAFAVRAAGYRVIYQPRSRVVHMEGITAGTDTSSGIKAYQVRNQVLFAEKWRDALAHQPAPGTLPTPAMLHAGRRQILIVDAWTPRPDHDSASLRLFNLIRMLVNEGAHVVFLPTDLHAAGDATDALRQLGVECWHAPFVRNLPAWFREHGKRFDAILLCRHHAAAECLPLARRFASKARVIFDTVDLHYLRESRAAELNADATLAKAAEATRRKELGLVRASDATLVVSPAERELLARECPGAKVEVLSNLHDVAGSGLPFAQRRDLVFVGGFRHPPNLDAAQWFGETIFPLVRARLPGVVFHCIGAEPPAAILRLAQQDGIQVHGHVPDLVPFMEGARISVAPLRYGAGVKGKVNLSMAHGQPVVATPAAVEGMHLHEGEDVLVADDPQAFADAVVRLYQDEDLWRRLAANGLDNVRRHFSTDAALAVVRQVFF